MEKMSLKKCKIIPLSITTDFQMSKISKSKTGNSDRGKNLEESLKVFFIIGKLLGLIPVRGLLCYSKHVGESKLRKFFGELVYAFLPILLFLCVVVNVIKISEMTKENAADYAWSATGLLFYTQSFFLYIFFLKKATVLCELLRSWDDHNSNLEYTEKDTRLFYHANWIAGIHLTAASLQSILYHLRLFPIWQKSSTIFQVAEYEQEKNMTALEMYYYRNMKSSETSNFLSYNPITALIILVGDKVGWFAGSLVDVFIISLSRAIAFKFKAFYYKAESTNYGNGGKILDVDETKKNWEKVRQDLKILFVMLKNVSTFLSPLIFTSVSLSMYFILQLHLGLVPKNRKSYSGVLETAYTICAFCHMTLRLCVLILAGSKVHDWTQKALTVFENCPQEAYTNEIQRTEHHLRLTEASSGLTGLGCFYITKPFLLQLLGVLFTIDLVLFQSNRATGQNSTPLQFPATACNCTCDQIPYTA